MTGSGAVFVRSTLRNPPGDPRLRARDERLEALKAVAGKLAHDFNNFLVPQFGYVTLIKEEIGHSPVAVQYASTMESAARKSQAYIESILLGMRPHRQFSPKEFALEALLASMLDDWVSGIPAATPVRLVRDLSPFEFFGDEKQWRSAIAHALSNARFALATGGELHVSLEPVTLSGEEVERLGVTSDEVARLVFRDTGFGMSPEVAQRAFEPFFTTRTFSKAPGLGLTIIHGVAQFHGGQVDLESAPDAGTTLTIWIPRASPSARERLASIGGSRSGTDRHRPRILLIERDPLIKEVFRIWAGECRWELQVAETGADALKLVQRNPADWPVVICEEQPASESFSAIRTLLQPVLPHARWACLAGSAASCCDSAVRLDKPVSFRAFRELLA